MIIGAMLTGRPELRATSGLWTNAAVDEVDALDGDAARYRPARMAAALSPLVVAAAVAFASPVAAAILMLTLIPFIAAMALAGGAAADQSRRQFAALARLSGIFADRIRALPLVLAYRAESRQAEFIRTAAEDVAERTLKVLRVAFLSSASLEFFAALSVALLAVYAGFNLLDLLPFPSPEKLDLPRAFFLLALAPEFYGPMRRLAAAYHDRELAQTARERLAPLAGPAAVADAVAVPDPQVTVAAPGIAFSNVTIRYAGEDSAAVSGFSLTVTPGQAVALVGPSGSGKTSLLHLLLGLAPLSGGTVIVGDRDLAAIGSLAPLAAWAGQHPAVVPGTLRDNIALANPSASAAQVADAAERVGLSALLAARGGLDASIDGRGGGLSGGERRRLALARALLKPAPFLLLDEPTAHLDADAEQALIAVIDRLRRGRTTIIATHSDALAALADVTIHLRSEA